MFARRRFHRAKAHLVLSAMRHRAAELGDRVAYRTTATYAEAVRAEERKRFEVVQPTSYAAVDLVTRLAEDRTRWSGCRRAGS